MSDATARILQNKWIICAVAGGVLLLWGMWQVIDVVKEILNGDIIVVN